MKTKEVIEYLKILGEILEGSDSKTFVSPCDCEFVSGFKEAVTRAIQMLQFMIDRNQLKKPKNGKCKNQKL